jgi:trk system potassium uptake protein TrkH
MNLRTIGWLVGLLLNLVSGALLAPLLMAVVLAEPWLPFAIAIAAGVGAGTILLSVLRSAERSLNHRSAFLAVTLAWLTACALGSLPFLLHPALQLSLTSALFESVAGFTTTGASVLSGIDALPRSVLLWRSLSQWLGGMGMVLLGVAVLPMLGVGGMSLYKAEAPGLSKDKITPRIAETAKLLWLLYLGVSVVSVVLLYIGGMTLFDAVCHTMAGISTGGFSTHGTSLAHYDSAYIHSVITLLMLTGGMSFAILHRALTQGISWSEHPELRLYIGIFVLATLLIALDLRTGMPDQFASASDSLEHAAFQAASILTTTGYTSSDFAAWPAFSQAILFTLFFVGGMAGSTGGGVKVIRVLLMGRFAFAQFFRLVHPHGFSAMKLGTRTVEEAVLQSVAGFIGMWIILLLIGTVLVAMTGVDPFTSLNSVAVSLGNIGPGLAGVGPSHTWETFTPLAKLTLAALMILGRLEIYTVLVILTPGFWRR